eukprot:m.929315 g.929315  ORF g.929315 m.929315 type:complete len:96 (+) comp23781_c0_seq22:237-524(+)
MSLLQSSDNESDDNPFLGESDEECEEASSASNSNDVGPILFKRKESFWREIPELKMGTSSDRAEALCKLPYWRRYFWTFIDLSEHEIVKLFRFTN